MSRLSFKVSRDIVPAYAYKPRSAPHKPARLWLDLLGLALLATLLAASLWNLAALINFAMRAFY